MTLSRSRPLAAAVIMVVLAASAAAAIHVRTMPSEASPLLADQTRVVIRYAANSRFGTDHIYGMMIAFTYSGRRVTLTEPTWSAMLPSTVHVVHSAVLLSWEQPPGSVFRRTMAGGGTDGWPPWPPEHFPHLRYHQLTGYTIEPPQRNGHDSDPLRVTVIIGLKTDSPGALLINPIIINMLADGNAYHQVTKVYDVLCIGQRSDEPCIAKQRGIPGQF
jgi:hypothetical protein